MDPKFVIPSRHHLSTKLTADAVGLKTVFSLHKRGKFNLII